MRSPSVIIPVFNRSALTAQCIAAMQDADACEVIVADDGSTDATPQVLAGLGSRIRVVSHATNRGFAASCNDGAAAASGDLLVFLNNDTIPKAGWLQALVEYAEKHPAAAVVGSKLLYPNETIQHAGVVIGQDRYPRHIYSGFPANHPAVGKSRRFQIVTAACMLVRRQAFAHAGGFDTAFRNGFEDVDLCLRLGQAGCEVHYCADSVVCHLESVSPGRFASDRDNVALYRERWLGRVEPDDLRYYMEDGLLRVSYEGWYPVHLRVDPLLAVLDGRGGADQVLAERARQVAELLRENARLRLELGDRAPESPALQYDRLRAQIREAVRRTLPPGATVLVLSKGDGALLDLPGCRGWHFPQAESGAYAGHHPADSDEAITQLEAIRARGAEYLLIPAPLLWWLDHYVEFRRHVESRYARLEASEGVCAIYALAGRATTGAKHACA